MSETSTDIPWYLKIPVGPDADQKEMMAAHMAENWRRLRDWDVLVVFECKYEDDDYAPWARGEWCKGVVVARRISVLAECGEPICPGGCDKPMIFSHTAINPHSPTLFNQLEKTNGE